MQIDLALHVALASVTNTREGFVRLARRGRYPRADRQAEPETAVYMLTPAEARTLACWLRNRADAADQGDAQ
jgi:hypothetical protein